MWVLSIDLMEKGRKLGNILRAWPEVAPEIGEVVVVKPSQNQVVVRLGRYRLVWIDQFYNGRADATAEWVEAG